MVNAPQRAAFEIAQQFRPYMLGLAGHDRIDMIKRLFGPIRDVRPAGNDADAKFTITVGERRGATGKAGEE